MKRIDEIVDSYRLESGEEIVVQLEDEDLVMDLWERHDGRLLRTVKVNLASGKVEVSDGV